MGNLLIGAGVSLACIAYLCAAVLVGKFIRGPR